MILSWYCVFSTSARFLSAWNRTLALLPSAFMSTSREVGKLRTPTSLARPRKWHSRRALVLKSQLSTWYSPLLPRRMGRGAPPLARSCMTMSRSPLTVLITSSCVPSGESRG